MEQADGPGWSCGRGEASAASHCGWSKLKAEKEVQNNWETPRSSCQSLLVQQREWALHKTDCSTMLVRYL